jgi:hypothetical protein
VPASGELDREARDATDPMRGIDPDPLRKRPPAGYDCSAPLAPASLVPRHLVRGVLVRREHARAKARVWGHLLFLRAGRRGDLAHA